MITEITKQLLTWRLGVLEMKDATTAQISMAKETMYMAIHMLVKPDKC
jgi:hypothetical protein